jgi:hypothetical protein
MFTFTSLPPIPGCSVSVMACSITYTVAPPAWALILLRRARRGDDPPATIRRSGSSNDASMWRAELHGIPSLCVLQYGGHRTPLAHCLPAAGSAAAARAVELGLVRRKTCCEFSTSPIVLGADDAQSAQRCVLPREMQADVAEVRFCGHLVSASRVRAPRRWILHAVSAVVVGRGLAHARSLGVWLGPMRDSVVTRYRRYEGEPLDHTDILFAADVSVKDEEQRGDYVRA